MKILSQVRVGAELVSVVLEGEKFVVISRNTVLNRRVVNETFANFTDAFLRFADVSRDAEEATILEAA